MSDPGRYGGQTVKLHLLNSFLEATAIGEGQIVVHRFPFVIGCAHNSDYRLDLAFISRHHCTIFCHGGRVWVRDLESFDGTYINGERVTEPRPLRDGDTLSLGPLNFRVAIALGSSTELPIIRS